MQLKVIELRQDRNLIKPNFSGYKLSLEPVPIVSEELTRLPFRAKPSEDQFSFLHVELFSLHNLLVKDPWNQGSSYYVSEDGSILRCKYDEASGRPHPPTILYTMNLHNRETGDYNISFRFLSEKFCLLCDGQNEVQLLETGDRHKESQWRDIFKCTISTNYKHFIIRDARLDTINEQKFVNIIFQNVGCNEGTYVTQLIWSVLKENRENKSWEYEVKDIVSGKGTVNYCAFEPRAKSIVLACHKDFTFQTKQDTTETANEQEQARNGEENISKSIAYVWSQTDEDITVKFNSTHSKDSEDYQVTCTEKTILVKCKENIILEGSLYDKIDADLTTWTLENDFLQVTLMKKGSEKPNWSLFVLNGPAETLEVDNIQITTNPEPVSHLESQTEECDHEASNAEEEYFIERLDTERKKTTHKVFLGSNAPLFSTCLRPGFPPAIATRQDVDACLWLQKCNPDKPDEWNLRHEGNLHAFGYVQASKEQKKFIDCSPDLSYGIICESHRHVFIYKSTYGGGNALRNRSGPQVEVGKQHLIILQDKGEVLGMSVDNFVTTLLTEKFILYLQVNS